MNSLENLKRVVIENSTTNDWTLARNEWKVIPGVREDPHVNTTCICLHPNLRYIYTIQNVKNGNILTPIGDICINHFNNNAMTNDANNYLALYRLCQAIATDQRIELTTKYFSRKLLQYLYDQGAFIPSSYNQYDPQNDYNFMIKMFNKHTPFSAAQQRKVNALIIFNIIPFASRILTTQSNNGSPIIFIANTLSLE